MNETFPGLIERIKAAVIDGLVMVLLLIAFSKIFAQFNEVPDLVRGAVVVFIFLLYDPVFTSLLGATIGHSAVGICIKRNSDRTKNLQFPMAVLRFAIKIALGWLSLLTVSMSRDNSAIHDMVAGSVVLYTKKANELA